MSHRAAFRTEISSGRKIGNESCDLTTFLKCSILSFITASQVTPSPRMPRRTLKMASKTDRIFFISAFAFYGFSLFSDQINLKKRYCKEIICLLLYKVELYLAEYGSYHFFSAA
jgi:hypothetical protein